MVRVLAVLLTLASMPARAATTAPSFEQSMGSARASVLAVRAAQLKPKASQEIQQLSWDAQRAARQASSLRLTLSDLRTRARDTRNRKPPVPDAFFKSQLQRFVFDLGSWARDLQALERRAMDLSVSAPKDPDSAAPAQQLVWDAQSLRDETTWISSDGSWLASDLRPLNLQLEAMEVERLTREGGDNARQLGYDADAILSRVR